MQHFDPLFSLYYVKKGFIRPQISALRQNNDTAPVWRRYGTSAGPWPTCGAPLARWLQVDAPELSPGHGREIQEVSRLGAQRVTAKPKLLAREMP